MVSSSVEAPSPTTLTAKLFLTQPWPTVSFQALPQLTQQVDFNLPRVHSTSSLTSSTPQSRPTNPRTFGIASITSTRHLCQSLSLNSAFIGSMGYFRIPQGLRSPRLVTTQIRIGPSTCAQVQLEPRFARETASGHSVVTLRSTRSCQPVIPSASFSRTTALFMSCSPSPPSLIPDGRVLQASVGASVGVLLPDLIEIGSKASSLIRRTDSAKPLSGQTS